MKRILLILAATAAAALAQPPTPAPVSPGLAPTAPAAPGRGGRGGGPQRTEVESHGPTPRVALLVGEKSASSLAIIDVEKLEIVARIPVGNTPHEVATDGKYAYVSNNLTHELKIVNLVEQKREPSFDMSPLGFFHGFAVSEGKLYSGHEATRLISRFDPATRKLDLVIGPGMSSHLLMMPDDKTIYLVGTAVGILELGVPAPAGGRGGGGRGAAGAQAGGGTAAAPANPAATPAPAAAPSPTASPGFPNVPRVNWNFTQIPLTARAEGFDVTPDGKELWAVATSNLSVVSLAEKKLLETIPVETTFTNRVRITRDGKHALLSQLRANELIVYDVATRKEVKRIDVGGGGEGIFIDPNGGRAFYAVSNANKLVVIDTNTLTIIKEIPGLTNPDGMTWYVRPTP